MRFILSILLTYEGSYFYRLSVSFLKHTLAINLIFPPHFCRQKQQFISFPKTKFSEYLENSLDFSLHEARTGERFKSSPAKVFLGKGVLKICSQYTGEHLH